jgi:hypothetical protein
MGESKGHPRSGVGGRLFDPILTRPVFSQGTQQGFCRSEIRPPGNWQKLPVLELANDMESEGHDAMVIGQPGFCRDADHAAWCSKGRNFEIPYLNL